MAAPQMFLVKRNRARPLFPSPAETRGNGLDQVDSAERTDTDNDAKERPEERQGCNWSFASFIFEIVSYLFFAVLYMVDSGSDIWTAYVYITDHENWYFGLTTFIVALSSLTLIVTNLYWYYCEYNDDKVLRPKNMPPKWVWAMRISFTLCLLGPFLRCVEICRLGLKGKRAEDERVKGYYRKRADLEIQDVAVLGLVESFMESAPQLGLQLYIMQTQGPEENFRLFIQTVSCLSSWVCCATALVSYSRANRVARPMKEQLTYPAMLMLFLWRLFTIGPRILALALFASIIAIRYYVFVAIACHWLLMTIYIIWRQTNYCNGKFFEILFNVLVGFIYIFTFWNIEDGHSRLRYTVYYILIYLENLGMVVTWFLLTTHAGQWYYIPSFLFVIIGFILGVAFMLAYYMGCHPKTIKLCLTKEDSVHLHESEHIFKDPEDPEECTPVSEDERL